MSYRLIYIQVDVCREVAVSVSAFACSASVFSSKFSKFGVCSLECLPITVLLDFYAGCMLGFCWMHSLRKNPAYVFSGFLHDAGWVFAGCLRNACIQHKSQSNGLLTSVRKHNLVWNASDSYFFIPPRETIKSAHFKNFAGSGHQKIDASYFDPQFALRSCSWSPQSCTEIVGLQENNVKSERKENLPSVVLN